MNGDVVLSGLVSILQSNPCCGRSERAVRLARSTGSRAV